VSPVKYELGSYIPEDDILHSPNCENHKSYIFKYMHDFRGLYSASELYRLRGYCWSTKLVPNLAHRVVSRCQGDGSLRPITNVLHKCQLSL
jgi:hypothetical protein